MRRERGPDESKDDYNCRLARENTRELGATVLMSVRGIAHPPPPSLRASEPPSLPVGLACPAARGPS
eukprot:2813654-Rhodomonas_salina.1